MQSNNKGKHHLRVRDCHNLWMGDYPNSWRTAMLRVARRRLASEDALIARLEQEAFDERSDTYQRYWNWYGDDDNDRNIESNWYHDWLQDDVAS
jgi:hypothetical protein